MENVITINVNMENLNEDERKRFMDMVEKANKTKKKEFSDILVGEVVKIADIEWIVLDHVDGNTVCLAKDFVYEDTQFDVNTNNFANSNICKKLNNLADEIEKKIGKDNLVETEIDLTSDDGLDDYGKINVRVGLLTCDMYRKYNRIIRKYSVNDWYWLATPYSTESNGYSYAVRCVCDGGALYNCNCNGNGGVRPFCIFKSNIFVS